MTAQEIIQRCASLLNDQVQAVYTDTVMLPYFNIALDELQEVFEQHNIPVTNEVSAVIIVPTTVSAIGFTTIPALPSNLIEIRQLWERTRGTNPFIPMSKVDFLPHYIEGSPTNAFMYWAWYDEKIQLPKVTSVNDLKLDYVKSLFAPVTVVTTPINLKNTSSFLQYRTAGLAAEFIGENITRAESLNSQAAASLTRSMGISIKGQQGIITRRRPFRAGFKRGSIY